MQLGFAFLEGGCVRYRNIQSIIIKVYANTAISIIMMWIVIKKLIHFLGRIWFNDG